MTRLRTAQHPQSLPRAISAEEIANGIARLHEVLAAIHDFSQEGFPYRDAARAKAELQLRECVKHIFGEDSDEFQTYRNYRLRTSNKAETSQSLAAVKRLVQDLEERKPELAGSTPPPTSLSSTAKTSPLRTSQIRPVPPAVQSKPSPAEPPPRSSPQDRSDAVETTSRTSVTRPTKPVSVPSPPASKTQKTQGTSPGSQPGSPPPTAPPPTAVRPGTPPAPPATPTTRPSHAEASLSATQQIRRPQTESSHGAAPTSVSATQQVRPAPSPIPPPPTQAESATLNSPAHLAAPPTTQDIPPPAAPATAPTSPDPSSPQSNPELDTLHLIRKVCLRFHAVARQLRLRKDSRPTVEVDDDYDLQDLLRALLKMEFDEVGVDEWTPPYAGSLSRTALLLNREQIVVVAKKTRSGLTAKEIAEQVAADSAFYSARNKCMTLFCFVYDPEGRIGSPKRLETDLTSISDRYMVEVLVAPK